MLTRFRKSWTLFQKSFMLIKQGKKLLIFPMFLFLGSLLLFLFFFVVLAAWSVYYGPISKISMDKWVAGSLVALVFPINFYWLAFISQIVSLIEGTGVSIRAGFAFAFMRRKAFLLWSLMVAAVILASMLVGIYLNQVLSLDIQRIVVWVCVWMCGVVSMFVFPALVCDRENDSPIRALKQSLATLKSTWVESIAGYAGCLVFYGVDYFILLLFALTINYRPISVSTAEGPVAAILLGLLLSGLLIVASWLLYILVSIYYTTLYLQTHGRPISAES